jgi:diguanylate cyclase (GGDEF)-like protein/PAS domain S-box-containing protein
LTLKVSICPHCLPKKTIWEKFFQNLGELLNFKLLFEEVKDFQKETEKIEKKEYFLYYASPASAYLLYKKGYHPIGKFVNQIDKLLIIGIKNWEDICKKEFIRVATINERFYILPIAQISYKFKMDFFRIEMILAETHEETLDKLIKGECDLGIISQDYLDFYPELRDKVRIFEEFTLKTSHYFMLNPVISKNKVLEALKRIDSKIIKALGYEGIDVFEKETIEKLESVFLLSELNFEILKARSLQELLLKNPFMGVLIYKERYVYTNSYICEITGYTKEEIYQLTPEELSYYEEDKKKIREVVKRRLKGEYFLKTWEDITWKSKEGRKVYIRAASTTIFYKGGFSGFVLLYDITKTKRLERLLQILKEINQTLIKVDSEKSFFEKIGKSLVEVYGLKMVWVGIPDYETKLIKPLYVFGEEKEYLKEIKVSMEEIFPEGRGPVGKAFREDKIQIVSDTEKDPNFSPWKEPALKRGYRSVSAIPLKLEGKVKYILVLYAEEPLFFEEENREILEEIKRDMEFGLKKIEMFRKEKILAETLRNLEEVVLTLNQEGTIIFINEAGCKLFESFPEEIVGKSIGSLGFKFKGEPLEVLFRKGLDKPLTIPVSLETSKGNLWFEMKIRIVKLDEEIFRYVLIAENISQILEFEEELNQARFVDNLTGLLNYEGFRNKVEEVLPLIVGEALMVVTDICDFTYINNQFGYEWGNFCLKEIAKRFSLFKEKSFISRVFSDSFAFFFYQLKDRLQIFEILKTLKDLVYQPIKLKDKVLNLTFNAGIAIYPQDGKTFEELWEKAGLALVEAKRKEKGTIEIYSSLMSEKIDYYFKSETLIKRAFEEELFVFYYQPYFEINTLKVIGMEALVRIKEKDGTLYLPSDFLEYLENSLYWKEFEEWGIKTIKEKILQWKIPISFNLSSKALIDLNFVKKLIKKFKDEQFFSNFGIEITERIIFQNVEEIKELVSFLKKQGIKVILDDFGIGYSSLSYLKDIPFDILKIDKIFVREMLKSKKETALVKSMIDIGHSFDMKVLAEGVETKEQLNYLDIMGCDYVQGFYLAKPMPEEEVKKLLNKK